MVIDRPTFLSYTFRFFILKTFLDRKRFNLNGSTCSTLIHFGDEMLACNA